ncbi:MAG: DNA gyrase C-terminal beta-propeller domain-containing protein, partial [Rufibacter sp.]
FGKRSALEEYRITNRGGKGVKTLNVTEKTGHLVAIKGVQDTDDLMIINKSGITIRLRVGDIRLIGRVSQGVRLLRLNEGDEISSVAKIEVEDKTEVILNESELPIDEALNPEDLTDPELTDPDTISEN